VNLSLAFGLILVTNGELQLRVYQITIWITSLFALCVFKVLFVNA